MTAAVIIKKDLRPFGFKRERGGAHTARTMMLEELMRLYAYVDDVNAGKEEYVRAIVNDNCLGKRSVSSRKLTAKYLTSLYSLDPTITIFRALRYFWQRDEYGRPLLALICAYARDAVLRISAPFILHIAEGEPVSTGKLEEYIEKKEPGRYNKATLTSTAQNINSTWTQSGHLVGYQMKKRAGARASAGAVVYVLLLGYLTGERGLSLFETDYAELLDCSVEQAIELAEDASRRGWFVFKRIGNVIEVAFPNLLTKQEMEWIRE